MESLHDHYISGYHVNGRARSLQLEIARPEDDQESVVSLHLTFGDVEGYLLEHDLAVNIIFAVEEQPLAEFLQDNAALFAVESKWGWPLFWQGSVEKTADSLSNLGARAWVISTSYGLSGWVVARKAAISEVHA
jgi:hypothetical protein